MFSGYRIDAAFETLLFEPTPWIVDSRNGEVLYRATGLRDAINRAAAISGSGAPVAAPRRDNVIVSSDQIAHVQKLIASREVPAIKEEYWDGDLVTAV
ncbi:MAG: hypothetical protein ABSA58_05470 [Acetobacteraceae bacterium]|jgi:hypothetical protein